MGGMRASIYNAMPVEGVEKLAAFMKVGGSEGGKLSSAVDVLLWRRRLR